MYPSTGEIDYYASKGFGIIRMPFDIARAYSAAYLPLNTTEIGYMKSIVDYCLSKGMHIVLDPHNYGFIYDNRTGKSREIGVDAAKLQTYLPIFGVVWLLYTRTIPTFFLVL